MNKSNNTLLTVAILCAALVMRCQASNSWDAMMNGTVYQVEFTPPSPPSGFTRTTLDPFDGLWFRADQYQWSNGIDEYSCAPKSYLNSNYLCQKDPRYWLESPADKYYCKPYTTSSQVPPGSFEDCYNNSMSAECHLKDLYCLTAYMDPEAF